MKFFFSSMFNFIKKSIFILTFVSIIFLPIHALFSQTYEDAYKPFWYLKDAGAKSASLAYNNTAISRGIDGLISNPALLGEVTNFQGQFSLVTDQFNQDARLGSSDNSFNNETSQLSSLDDIGLVYPVPVYRGSFVLGISYTNRAIYNYLSKSSGWQYESDPEYRYYLEEDIIEEGRLNSLNLGGAIEVEKGLFLGLSFHLYNGFRDFKFTGIDEDRDDLYYYDRFNLNKNIETDYFGWNFSLGTLYKGESFKWGVKLATPLKLKATENSTIDTTMYWDDGVKFDTSLVFKDLEYKTAFPTKISSGLSFNINQFVVSLDIAINNWNDIDFDSDLEDAAGVSADKRIKDNISQYLARSTDYGFGLMIPITQRGQINLGYRSIGKPIEELSGEYERLLLYGLGFDYQVNQNMFLNLSYQLATGNNNQSHYFYTDKEENYRNHRLTLSTGIIFN
ncbi:MAG TPA: hypothetical protein VKP78_07380 [bacterium]|nr:hypothetical protein [bacterium]